MEHVDINAMGEKDRLQADAVHAGILRVSSVSQGFVIPARQ
jgi:hypothetical protein